MMTARFIDGWISGLDCAPWGAAAGRTVETPPGQTARRGAIYTPEQRRRRDESRWTMVQGVLAPIQFAAFVVSLALVGRYLETGSGYAAATVSIIAKTLLLYTIMITGSIWERDVFGKFLFAPAFFWEDVVSILVLALHTTYLVALLSGAVDHERQMWLALTAYVTYVVNATQFVLKLRAARLADKFATEPYWHGSGVPNY